VIKEYLKVQRSSAGVAKLDKVNWEHLVDYFRWEAHTISSRDEDDEFEIKARELQEHACKKYGSRFLRYLLYANPDTVK